MKCTKKTEDTEEQKPLDWRVGHLYKELDIRISRNNKDIMFLINEMQKKIERLERRIEKLEEKNETDHRTDSDVRGLR